MDDSPPPSAGDGEVDREGGRNCAIINDENFISFIGKYAGNGDDDGDISLWDVRRVTDMTKLYETMEVGGVNAQWDLSGWCVADVLYKPEECPDDICGGKVTVPLWEKPCGGDSVEGSVEGNGDEWYVTNQRPIGVVMVTLMCLACVALNRDYLPTLSLNGNGDGGFDFDLSDLGDDNAGDQNEI
jgi:hypothetical protein